MSDWNETVQKMTAERADKAEAHPMTENQKPILVPALGAHFSIEHDGFTGTVIGHYVRLDGKRGVVLQQDGTKVVHVYGEKWLKPDPDMSDAAFEAKWGVADVVKRVDGGFVSEILDTIDPDFADSFDRAPAQSEPSEASGLREALQSVRDLLFVEHYEDGRVAAVGHDSNGLREMVAILDVALRTGQVVEPEPVAVKPLEWEPCEEWMQYSKEKAPAFGGEYQIVFLDPEDAEPLPSLYFEIGLGAFMFRFEKGQDPRGLPGETCPRTFPSVEEAKAAAQADYEKRIRSALVVSPDTEQMKREAAEDERDRLFEIANGDAEVLAFYASKENRRFMADQGGMPRAERAKRRGLAASGGAE